MGIEDSKNLTLKDGYALESYPNIVVFSYENNGLEAEEIWKNQQGKKKTHFVDIMIIPL